MCPFRASEAIFEGVELTTYEAVCRFDKQVPIEIVGTANVKVEAVYTINELMLQDSGVKPKSVLASNHFCFIDDSKNA